MDKRYKFVRSENPFEGLGDYINSPEVYMANKKMEYPIQLSLEGIGNADAAFGLRTKLGRYFEILVNGIYGGRLGCREISDQNGKNDQNSFRTMPDVSHYDTNCFREVKGVSPGESLKFLDDQTDKYTSLQKTNILPKKPRITYEVFRHGISKLQSKFENKSLDDLVLELSKTTKYMFSIPASVGFKIHGSENKYTSRYDGNKYDKLTKFLSTGMNSLIACPQETLEKLGLNIEDFEIKKRKFPEGVTINNLKIKPFPILIIRDKDHRSWLNKFEGGDFSDEPLPF